MTRFEQLWSDMIKYDQIWPDMTVTRYDQIWPDMIRTLWLGCFSQLGNWTAPRTRCDINRMVVFCCSCTLQNTYFLFVDHVFLFVGHGFIFIEDQNISLASNEFWTNQVHLHFALVEVWRGVSACFNSSFDQTSFVHFLDITHFLLFWKISGGEQDFNEYNPNQVSKVLNSSASILRIWQAWAHEQVKIWYIRYIEYTWYIMVYGLYGDIGCWCW